MDKTIQLIVVKCQKTPNDESFSSYGDRIVDERFTSLVIANSLGEMAKREGWRVIIRPNYNEEDIDGPFFREWRSFNGEPFNEVRWRF